MLRPNASIPAGTQDLLGNDLRYRVHMINVLCELFLQFGFEQLETPIIELASTFHGHHGEGEALLFKFADAQLNDLVLRYDLTVPLARVMVTHPDIPRPYKRFQIGPVFRDDAVDPTHLREFTQCDGDVVGVDDRALDAEMIILGSCGLDRLGFKNHTIRINHRSLVRGVSEYACGHSSSARLFTRALDFADKSEHGLSAVGKALNDRGVDAEHVERAISLLKDARLGDCNDLDRLETRLAGYDYVSSAVNDLRAIMEYLPAQVGRRVTFDPFLARGADYYTGIIFEGNLPDAPGAMLGGGRYDGLTASAGGTSEPAVGLAFGLDRLFRQLREKSTLPVRAVQRVVIYSESNDLEAKKRVMTIAGRLRASSVAVDIDFGSPSVEGAVKRAICTMASGIILCPSQGEVRVRGFGNNFSSILKKIWKTQRECSELNAFILESVDGS